MSEPDTVPATPELSPRQPGTTVDGSAPDGWSGPIVLIDEVFQYRGEAGDQELMARIEALTRQSRRTDLRHPAESGDLHRELVQRPA